MLYFYSIKALFRIWKGRY